MLPPTMWSLRRDVGRALRTVVRHRGTALVAALCFGLGIAVVTTMFAAADPWVSRPLPYADPDRLMAVREVSPAGRLTLISAPLFSDLHHARGVFASAAALVRHSYDIGASDDPESVHGASITASLFPMLGVRPVIGRTFTSDEAQPHGPHVCLIGYSLWRTRFSADPAIAGHTLQIDDVTHVIVGVMPPGWGFPEFAQVWTPLELDPSDRDRTRRGLDVLARLGPGVGREQAAADLAGLARRAGEQDPDAAGWGLTIETLRASTTPPGIRTALRLLMAASAMVLLIACANVANLLLTLSVDRRREVAVRVALGAGRRHLVADVLVESTLLSLAGGALGIAVAIWGTAAIQSWVPIRPPFWAAMTFSGRALAVTLASSIAASLAAGILPALEAVRGDVRTALGDGGRSLSPSTRTRRIGGHLATVQLAVSLVLLSSALLLVRSYWQRQTLDPGFTSRDAITVHVALRGERYRIPEARRQFLDEAVRDVRRLTGVETAAAVRSLPFSDELGGGWSSVDVDLEDRPLRPSERPAAVLQSGTADSLVALGIPLVGGRMFRDDEEPNVAVVSDGFRRRFWPAADPIGRRIRLASGRWLTIVGVAGDVREPSSLLGIDAKPAWQIYVPYAAEPSAEVVLVARGPRAVALAGEFRQAVRRLDPRVRLSEVVRLDEARRRADWVASLWGRLLAIGAAAGLLLACVGVYGVLARTVARRTQEIGIRLALGANPAAVVRLILRQGLWMASSGVVLGLAGSLALTRSLSSLLYGVSASDPLMLAVSAMLLFGIAMVATWVPASRAARVDPMRALRVE